MDKKRVLYVVPTLDQSGAEKQLTLLASRLPRDRYETAVCALTRGGYFEGPLRDADVPVYVLGKRFKWDPVTLYRLCRLIMRLRPDVVHTWLFAGNCYGRVAARWSGRPRLVASERCVDRWKHSFELSVDRFLARHTDAVVVNAQAVHDFYAHVGIQRSKLRVIVNADDARPATSIAASTVREQLQISPETPVIGYIGRLWPQKRVHDLIWAADVLRIAGAKVKVLIVGDGPRRLALERFARNIELDGVVQFLGHRSDASVLLSAMDVVVLPSEFEGMPNVALEAMQAGKPIVATRIAGMDEVVVHEMTGLLVGVGQPFALAKALRRLLVDAELRRRMGEAGRARVRDCFSVTAMIDAYDRLYREVLGQ